MRHDREPRSRVLQDPSLKLAAPRPPVGATGANAFDAEQTSNEIIEARLKACMARLEEVTSGNVMCYVGPIAPGLQEIIREELEAIPSRRRKLSVILETPGGFIEVVERVATLFRRLYRRVEFIVPTEAMSAGTVLVMSGDAIWMDFSSVLGPIDPQIQRGGSGVFVPALGYLEQYARLVDKSKNGTLTTAELAYLIQRFDPAELYSYEQARDLSIALLKQWLVEYKFKNWTRTKSRQKKVTKAMKTERADSIARLLNDTSEWHSHSRGISMEVLRRKLKLEIDDFGAHPQLGRSLRAYWRLLRDYTLRRGHDMWVLHTIARYHGHAYE